MREYELAGDEHSEYALTGGALHGQDMLTQPYFLPSTTLDTPPGNEDRPFEGLSPSMIRERLADAYETYQPHIAELRAQVAELESPSLHPQHLGSGRSANTYIMEVDAKPVVVRLPLAPSQFVVNTYVAGFAAAPYLPRHEAFLAMTDEGRHGEYATVSEVVPGTDMIRIGAAAMRHITQHNLHDLADALLIGHDAGLDRDGGPGNRLFHPVHGFGIVDYTIHAWPPSRIEDFCAASWALSGRSIPVDFRRARPSFYHERNQASVDVVAMWRSVCEQRFSGGEGEWLLLQVDDDRRWLDKQLRRHG